MANWQPIRESRKTFKKNSSTRQECIDLMNDYVDDKSDNNYERFTGLVHLKNDCWLNCLLKCFNILPLRRILLDGLKDGCVSNVTAVLT